MMKPWITKLLMLAALWCGAGMSFAAQPRLTLGVVAYNGSGGNIVVPVVFSNDGNVRAVQFDLQYPQGSVDLGALLPGVVLSPENELYSGNVSGAPASWVQRRVLVTPTTINGLLSSGALMQISLVASNPPAINGIQLKVVNVMMADLTAKAVAANTCAIGGFIYNPNDTTKDSDADGVTNVNEAQLYSTNPGEADSECDGIPDGYEVANGLNALVNDAAGDLDGDGVLNYAEYIKGTKAAFADSDGDGLPDGFEIATTGFNPNNSSDGYADWDGDGLTNAQEYSFGTNMNNADTNGNGISDIAEYQAYVASILVPIINYLLE